MSSSVFRWAVYLFFCLAIGSCVLRVTTRTVALAQAPAPTRPVRAVAIVPTPTTTPTPSPTFTPVPPSPTPIPTATLSPLLVGATQTAAYNICALYSQIPPELMVRVDRQTALPRDYAPPDLTVVPLDTRNTSYSEVRLRQMVQRPLLDMLDAMNQAGLSVWVASGFRSYSDQKLAYDKWLTLYPERAPEISAVPGHSEHQLGTAVDFTTPYMDDLYGDFFNIRFAETNEGKWLARQAAYYGFTLSYPQDKTAATEYAWEPWHFRYVGILAQNLLAQNLTLTEYIQLCGPKNTISGP